MGKENFWCRVGATGTSSWLGSCMLIAISVACMLFGKLVEDEIIVRMAADLLLVSGVLFFLSIAVVCVALALDR